MTQLLSTPRRSICAAVAVSLLLSACASPVAQAIAAVWPEPASGASAQWPQHRRPHPEQFGPISNRPNFSAPSADHCRQTPALRETPSPTPLAGQSAHAVRLVGTPAPMVMRAAPAESVAMAAPAPASAPSPAPVPPPPPPPAPTAAEAANPTAADRRAATATALPWPQPPVASPQPARPANEPVTAGLVDDNAGFSEYQAFRNRTRVSHLPLDIAQRQLVEVKDTTGRGVSDAEVLLQSTNGAALWARTDAAGRAWVHPRTLDGYASAYQITARSGSQVSAPVVFAPGQKSAVEVRLGQAAAQERARLDLVFLIDATGSMADEIDKLKTSMHRIADDVARLPSRPDTCFAFVAYRDRGDAFLLRTQDLTNDLGSFQRSLAALHAGSGGDYPEAMGEALMETVHALSWRGGKAAGQVQRMVVLLADAPPHFESDRPAYTEALQAALGKGIKINAVAASGLDKQGEFIHRQIAQFTGGKFVFLTYAQAHSSSSGPGRETVHDVQNYSVDTLDSLIVRLVREELLPVSPEQR